MEHLQWYTEAHYLQTLVLCSNGMLRLLMQVFQFKRLTDRHKTLLSC